METGTSLITPLNPTQPGTPFSGIHALPNSLGIRRGRVVRRPQVRLGWNRRIAERFSEGVAVVDPQCRVLFANQAAHTTLGYPGGALRGRRITECLSARVAPKVVAALEEMAKGIPHPYQATVRGPDGRRRHILITSVSVIGSGRDNALNYLVVFRDISREKQAASRLKHLLTHDRLTGLYNRTGFEKRVRSSQQTDMLPISVIMADINGLKRINDAFGSQEGDKCIALLSKAFRRYCQDNGIIGRWGGGTLVCLAFNLSHKRVHEVVSQIRVSVENSSDLMLPPTISFGIVLADGETNIDELLSKAEDRLRRNKLLQKDSARSGIIASLEHSLWTRSHETVQHAQRVRRLALKVGRLIHVSDSEMDELALLAMLHDIGKICVPDTILRKAGSLTPAEWKIMRTHSEVGHRIASAFPEMSPVAAGVLAHHERWDGTGYPNRLRGQQIPLAARIISICDSFDSMLHSRPYRKALSRKAALREIRANAGTQFDPDLVDAFMAVLDREESSSVTFLPGVLPFS